MTMTFFQDMDRGIQPSWVLNFHFERWEELSLPLLQQLIIGSSAITILYCLQFLLESMIFDSVSLLCAFIVILINTPTVFLDKEIERIPTNHGTKSSQPELVKSPVHIVPPPPPPPQEENITFLDMNPFIQKFHTFPNLIQLKQEQLDYKSRERVGLLTALQYNN